VRNNGEDRDHRDILLGLWVALVGTVIPEYAVSARSVVLHVGYKHLAILSRKRRELVGV
jgi:hypothetical protein